MQQLNFFRLLSFKRGKRKTEERKKEAETQKFTRTRYSNLTAEREKKNRKI